MGALEFRAKKMQEDPRRMVKIWENSLREATRKIDAEPDIRKKEQMRGKLEFAKARLSYYKSLI